MKTTKKDVLMMFPDIKEQTIETYGKSDKIALSEAWNNFVDSLLKDGVVTRRQFDHWVNPF